MKKIYVSSLCVFILGILMSSFPVSALPVIPILAPAARALLSDNSDYTAQMRWNNKLRNLLEKLHIMSKKYKKEIIGVEKNENNSVHNIG